LGKRGSGQTLDERLRAIRDPENKKLKEAVLWAIKQCDTRDQYS